MHRPRRTHRRSDASSDAERLALGVIALITAAGLGIMTTRMAGAPPTKLDRRVRRRATSAATPDARRAIHLLTGAGHPSVYFPATALLVHALRRRGLSGGVALAIAAGGGWATHRAIKLFIHRRRPRTMRGHANEFEAFPSGHTTASTAVALTAAWVLAKHDLLPRESAIGLAVGPPLAIGAGRVMADQHWTTDVVGGWLGGVAVAAIAVLIEESTA
jgi:membrane-associated phospholipid phosphatase